MTREQSHAMSAAGLNPPAADMVWIPSGTFTMGSDRHYREEAPARDVSVDGFGISRTPTTNAQYAKFVEATGYVTVAERPLDPADFPGAPAENLVPGSMVFVPTAGPVDLRHLSQWWVWTPGASWHQPHGPGSTVTDRGDHPVVHVSAQDVEAYAEWKGLSLPTEAEWERAARGNVIGASYTWGDEPESTEARRANYYHGAFPYRAEPGYGATTPVGRFPANDFGLVDMAGNVWEWTSDWYVENRFAGTDSCCIPDNPRGGNEQESLDSNQPQFSIPRRVLKGGSFLCADEYCLRYRPAARRPQPIDTGMSHIGFRCAYRLRALKP
jgi:sulfatase modifying factor 1